MAGIHDVQVNMLDKKMEKLSFLRNDTIAYRHKMADKLTSFHPETPDEKLLVSDSERRHFSSRQGNQGIARRRTSVHRTSKPED
jgi:hypothetical protein